MQGFTAALASADHPVLSKVPLNELIIYFSNSLAAGVLLSMVTMWALLKLPSSPESMMARAEAAPLNETQAAHYKLLQKIEARLNAVTILFLCVGMTGVMILVSNSLARAFAVGAAISLVRFRIRLDKPGLSTALFFSVVVGMACGVGYVQMAWVVALLYTLIQTSLVFMSMRWVRNEEAKYPARKLEQI